MGPLLAFAIISIAVSFVCSVLEAVLLSVTPSYVANQRESNPRLYKQLKRLKDHIDKPLAAILTLNTIAHTFGAAGVGAQVGIVFGDGYLAIASVIMTLLVLILSEIIPKSLGAKNWRTLAPFMPLVLNVLIVILKPAIRLSDLLTKWMGAGIANSDLRSEIKALTDLGAETGELDADEQRVIANILSLHEIKLRDIMTPRTVCEYVSKNDTAADMLEKLHGTVFSRFPVLDEDEHPHGVVFRTDILEAELSTVAETLMKPVQIFTDDISAETLLGALLEQHQHMCLVYDEYGTWMGLVTLEDILETILGQAIMDETDDIPNMRRHARRRWEHRLKHR